MEELLKILKAKGLVSSTLTLEEFKKMGGGANAKAFHDQLIKANNPQVENESLLVDDLKDFDTYVERFNIDTSFDIDDTKIEPLPNPYEGVDMNERPEELNDLEGDDKTAVTNTIADENSLKILTDNYENKKAQLIKDNPPNKARLLKDLEIDFNKAKKNIELGAQEKNAFLQLNKYKGTNSINPTQTVEVPDNEDPLNKTQFLGGTIYKKVNSSKTQEGIHSWLFPELTTNYLAGATGTVDYNVESTNNLWTRTREGEFLYSDNTASDKSQNLLAGIIEAQYPGYTVRPYERSTKDVYKKNKWGVVDYTKRAETVPNITKNRNIPISHFGEVGVVDQEGSGGGSEAYSYRMVDGENGKPIRINGEELIVTSPDGKDEISVFTEVGVGSYIGDGTRTREEEDQAVEKFLLQQKIKLANFVNKHGSIDLSKINTGKSNLLAKTANMLNKPVNVNDPSEGGIAPNEMQVEDLLSIGEYNANGEFTVNAKAFSTYNQLVVEHILKTDPTNKGGLSEATIKNPNTRAASKDIKNSSFYKSYQIESTEPQKPNIAKVSGWQTLPDNSQVWVDKGGEIPFITPEVNFGGNDLPLPMVETPGYTSFKEQSQAGTTSASWNPAAPMYQQAPTNLAVALEKIEKGIGLRNPYREDFKNRNKWNQGELPEYGPNSAVWLQTEKSLQKAFDGEPVPYDLIASSVAQQEYNKLYDKIREDNLSAFLWDAENNNYRQQLVEYYNIDTRDRNLISSMALMAVNQADLIEYTGINPVNESVNKFEEIYNNPKGEFTLDESQPIVTLRNGKQVNKSVFEKYIKARSTKENQLKSMLDVRDKVWKLQDKQSDIDANLKLLGKEYDAWNSSVDALGIGFADIGTGLLYLAGKTVKYTIGNAWTIPGMAAGKDMDDLWKSWDDAFVDTYDDYARWKTEVKENYGKELSFHANRYGQGGAFTNATNFGRFVGMEVGKQIPILATMIASGGTAAPWVIGAYSAGQHWAEGDLREFHSGKAENEWIQAISSIGYGAAEGVFEALTTVPILKRGKALMQRSGAKSMLNYKNSMKQYFKENALFLASSPVSEASAEFMTSIAQNAIDGRPLLENADHAAFVGGMFGFGMSTSPFLAGAVARQFTDYNSFSEFKKKDDQIRELQTALDYLEKDGSLSAESLEVQKEALSELREDQKAFVAKKFNAIENTMSGNAYDAFMENTRRQANSSAAANEMMKNGVDSKFLEIEKMKFDLFQAKADIWRNNGNFGNTFSLLEGTNKREYDRLWQEAKNQLAKENNGKVRDDQIPQRAEELYIGEQVDANFKKVSGRRKSKNKKYFKFDTNGEALTYIDDVLETSKEIIQNDNTLTDEQKANQIKDLEVNIRGFKNGLNSGSAMGGIAAGNISGWNLMFDSRGVVTTDANSVSRNEILGFRENAIKNNETQIFTHEASHAEFGEILGYDSKAFEPLAEDVTKYLQETHPDIWEAMVARRGSALNNADEVVMNFLEYVGNGDIDLNNKPGKLMGSSFGFNLNSIFKKNKKSDIDFKGANESIQYLYDLGKAISEGRVTRTMVKEYRKKAVFKEMRDNFSKAKRKAEKEAKTAREEKNLKNLKKELENFKFSDTKQYESAADILKDLNELVAKNKISPVKNYRNKVDELSNKFKELKAKAGVVEKVPVFNGDTREESDAARKERVNLIERSFRGRLETFQGGKPMAEILRAYEGNIETLFKKGGYFATDSYQRFESFNEALAEFTALTNIELMKSVRAFNPTKNNDFDAYMMSPTIMTNKVKLANKKIGAESKNQGFNVGLEAASGVAVSENTSVQEFDKTIREVFGVEKGSPFYGAAMSAVQDVMAKGLPKFEYTQRKKKGKGEKVTLAQVRATIKTNPTGEVKRQVERDLAGIMKKVKSELQTSYQTALDKSVKNEFLKSKIYDTFLKKNRSDLLARLPIEDLVQLQKMAKEKILAKVVKTNLNPTEVKKFEGSGNLTTATTTQGPTLYTRLNPSEKAFVDFFNVRGRKNALAKILSSELGLDATMQNLTSEKVVEEVSKGNPEIKEQLGEQALKDFALAIGRGTAFKFSLAETVGIEGKLAEDYKALQPTLIDQIINMEVSDPMSVKLAVDVIYSDGKFIPYRTKIKSVFEKLLKPYRKAVKQEGKTDFNLEEYITSVESSLDAENSIAKMFGQKPMAKANQNPTDISNFKKFDNRNAQQRLLNRAGKDSDGKQNPVTEEMKIEQAALDLRFQYGRQNGTKPGTAKARGFVYANSKQLFNEFFTENYGFTEAILKKKDGKRTLQFKKTDGELTAAIPFDANPVQKVTEQMVFKDMSKEEMDFREKIANEAFNYVVDSYKAAKQLLDGGGATKLDIAMLMNMYGQAMEGPIRAAAVFKYKPIDAPFTSLRNKDGGKNFEYEHGIPAKIFNLLVADAVFFDNKNIDLQKLKDSYAVGAIPVDMNENFSAFFADRMQFGYEVGDIAPMRWYNMFTRGRAAYAVEDIRTGDKFGEQEAKLWKEQQKANEVNKYSLSNNVVDMKNLNADEVLSYASSVDAALRIARDPNAPVKKIRVFDFDDTLATSENLVFYTMPDGSKGQLNAEEFAKQGAELKDLGAVMDFTDFNTVREGGEGPLADLARTIIEKRGSEDVFVLTARAQESAQAIYDFLQGIGIKIPFENITGLGNSTGEAKAQWIIEKAANGYNDFYFADDAIQNVKAVKDALSVIDVKSKVQQAKFKFSENIDEDFNKILENSFGIEWYKEFSGAKGKMIGQNKGNRMVHPYSAEDFEGLLYPLLGKGKTGEANYQWFKDHLIDPYNRGVRDMNTARINLMDDFKALKNTLDGVPKTMRDVNSSGFTNENSMRVFIWSQLGYDIPGVSKTDLKEINDLVENNEELRVFAEVVMQISKGDYSKPGTNWLGGNITTDFIDVLNDVKRKDFLSEFIQNSDIIFSDKNMAKLEASLGPKYVEAVKNILARMKSGSNRLQSQNRIANGILDYLNNAQGVVLFLNMRSALLQGISSMNFINWSNNNIYKAGKAFANQPQYWSDFTKLMNSDYLTDRRNGLKMNINENEIANLAKTSKNKAKAVVAYIIEKGYTPTKFMDSFAIASGGSTFFRNRLNELIEKEGLSAKEAETQAYKEFVDLAEKSQQSSDPSKISSQQASDLGRIFLNWANTQMQYLRIQKKAGQDIINRRGNDLENASKIIYYGVIQNLWFQAAHSAVFALAFGDEDDDPAFKDNKIISTANGMTDNILRGLGISGQVISVLKNTAFDVYERSNRKRPEYVDAAWELVRMSPVISSKVSRVKQALWHFDSKKRRQEMIDKGFSIDNPAYMATAKVISAITNVPIDRLLLKMENVMAATSAETETWMSIALLLGWPKWQLEAKKKEADKWGTSKSSSKSDSNFGKPKGGFKKDKTWGQPISQ